MTRVTVLALTTAMAASLTVGTDAQKNKATCGSDVPVTVSIAGSDAEPLGYALVADGGGPYINSSRGSDKITAIFQVNNCSHDFTMNLNFSRRSMWALLVDPDTETPFVRRANFFNFDRVASVPVTTAAGFLGSDFCSLGWARNPDGTVAKNDDGTWRDNYGGCGSDGIENYVLRGGGVSLDGDERLGFARSPIDLNQPYPCPGDPVCEADYVRVYHPDANTWILRPHDIAQASYSVWNSGAHLFEGYQFVPFEITVTRP